MANGGKAEHVTPSRDKQRKQASSGHIACLSLWLFPSVHLDLSQRKHLHLKRSFVSREHFHVHDFSTQDFFHIPFHYPHYPLGSCVAVVRPGARVASAFLLLPLWGRGRRSSRADNAQLVAGLGGWRAGSDWVQHISWRPQRNSPLWCLCSAGLLGFSPFSCFLGWEEFPQRVLLIGSQSKRLHRWCRWCRPLPARPVGFCLARPRPQFHEQSEFECSQCYHQRVKDDES